MHKGSNGPQMGQYNRSVILDAIREADGVSRVELAGRTGLTTQTVSNIVRRLIDDGLVAETGLVRGALGKPRTVLRINVRSGFAVGVHVDPTAIRHVLVDLAGQIIATASRYPQPGGTPAAFVKQIVAGVESMIVRAGIDRHTIVGVGVGVPGSVDAASGDVIVPPNLPGWGRVPLRDNVSALLGLPVTLDNDATAAALGERWVGRADRAGDFAFIYLGTGVGCGLFLAGQIFSGESHNAGEFGHVSIDVKGRSCHCGNVGCLEAYIAPAAIRDIHHLELSASSGRRTADLGWAGLARAYATEDRAATAAVDEAAVLLADAVVGLVNILDVPTVVIGGTGLGALAPRLAQVVEHAVNTRTLARRTRTVRVVPSAVGDSVGAIGAASLVLTGNFAPHTLRLQSAPAVRAGDTVEDDS